MSNSEFLIITQPQMVRLPRNEKQTYWLNSRAQMWPSDLTLTMTLTLNLWNLLKLSQKWFDCHETKRTHIDWTISPECTRQIWLGHDLENLIFKVIYGICYILAKMSLGLTLAMTLTLDFQGQILKQPYLRNSRADWHWTNGGHSWPWP